MSDYWKPPKPSVPPWLAKLERAAADAMKKGRVFPDKKKGTVEIAIKMTIHDYEVLLSNIGINE